MSKHCEHKKQKRNCIICSCCEHKKIKRQCLICSGCIHQKRKERCKICNKPGSGSICFHNKIVEKCIICNSCIHQKRNDRCKICLEEKNLKGDFCDHGKIKSNCVECSACDHGKIKSKCIECSACDHGKFKRNCGICNPAISCKNEFCYTTIHNKFKFKYDEYCARCFCFLFPSDKRTKNINTNSKEITILKYLTKNNFFEINGKDFIHDKTLYTGNCKCNHRRRIDFRILINNTLLCIEVDENQHKSYKDEEIRYNDLYMVFSGKWIFIRINPDEYKIKNKLYNPKFPHRCIKLGNEIKKHIERIKKEENKELLEIHKMFYDRL